MQGSLNLRTNSFRCLNRLAPFSFVSALVLSFLMFNPLAITSNKASATTSAVESSITITSLANSATVDVRALTENGFFATSTAEQSASFALTTNNYTGYTLSIMSDDDDGNLSTAVEPGDTPKILNSISGITSAEDFSASTVTAAENYNSKWGIRPSKYVDATSNTTVDNTGDNPVYLPSPTTIPTLLDKTTSANATANTYTLALGIRANQDTESGVYTKVLGLAVIANPVSYIVEYDQNTDDVVTNMPATQANDSMTDISLALSDAIPLRDHYSFIGWCDVQPTTTNEVDSCAGTIYNPNGDGTNLTYSINQTTMNEATLYAMWKIDTFTCNRQYRLQNADGSWGEYQEDVSETVNYGGSCSYSKTMVNYRAENGSNNSTASASVSNITSDVILRLDLYRNTYTCVKRYRLQNVDGTWGEYQEESSETVNYGGSCSYSKDATGYHAYGEDNDSVVSASASDVASDVTLSLDLYRNTYTCTKRYRLQNADGSWGEYQEDTSETVNYGGTCYYSKTVADYRAGDGANDSTASTGIANVVSNTTLSLDLYRNTYTCTKRYRLQNVDGTWGEYQEESSETVNYGGSCSYSKDVTGFHAYNENNDSVVSASASNITSDVTFSLDLYRNTYTCTKRYRLQNADGSWGEYQEESSETVNYGGTCSYNKNITGYHASGEANDSTASASVSNITSDVVLSLDLYKNTYTCTKRYRLQNADGSWGEYQEESSETVNYGDSCSYSKAITNYRAENGPNSSTVSASASNITSDTTLDLDLYRNTFTCTKRYRLQNVDGTWGEYQEESSETINYGGLCSYSKNIEDYRAGDGANGSTASTSIANVISNTILNLNLYRNTYNLTVYAGSNTNSPTGSGTYRWGENVAVGVTKASNTACNSYGTPTWSQSGTAGSLSSTSGVSTTFTIGKGNAVIIATSASSSIAQPITLSRSGGVSSINIGGTNYTEDNVSLDCGTYNISGNYDPNYEFDSWNASGVSVANTSVSSTIMTVSGAGTLTLVGKLNCVPTISGYMQNISSTTNYCAGASGTVTDSRDGTSYAVGKLADGRIWLLDNLALDLTNAAVQNNLTAATTNASNTTLNYLKNGGGTTSNQYAVNGVANWTDAVVSSYSDPLVAVSGVDGNGNSWTKDTTQPFAMGQPGSGKIGAYYNYCAATAGSFCYGNGKGRYDDAEDICPKGWHLPTGYQSGEYQALLTAYSNNNIAYVNAFRVALYGTFNYGRANNQGSYCYLYSSTRVAGGYVSYLYANTSTVYPPSYGNDHANGFPIRCVLNN